MVKLPAEEPLAGGPTSVESFENSGISKFHVLLL
jgi:hypothetical protein